MRRSLTVLVVSLVISISCFGQGEIVELNAFLTKIKVVDELSSLNKQKFESLSILTVQNELDRTIDFGFTHIRKMIITEKDGDFRIDIITKGDSIKLGLTTILNWKNNEPKSYEFFYTSDLFLTDYLEKHNNFYLANLKKNQFIEQLNNEYTVGFGCGIVGMDIPKYSGLSQRYIKHKNRKKLNTWLRSFSPELQALGTIGLYKLGSLSKDEMNIIKHLKRRNTTINTCLGCIYGFQEKYKNVIKINIEN